MDTLQSNSLVSRFKIGQKVQINHKGFIPYSLCGIEITGLGISSAIVKISFTHKGKKSVELNVHIPYEHLKYEE